MIESGIVLIDGDSERRTKIARMIMAAGAYVEPFETVKDYVAYPIRAAVILVASDHGKTLDALTAFRAHHVTHSMILAYKESPDCDEIVSAMTAGANDYLEWPFDSDTLKRSLDKGISQYSITAPRQDRKLAAMTKLNLLTPREKQVLELLTSGLSSKEVAKELAISHRTVEIHRGNIMLKVRAKNVAQLVRMVVESEIDDFNRWVA